MIFNEDFYEEGVYMQFSNRMSGFFLIANFPTNQFPAHSSFLRPNTSYLDLAELYTKEICLHGLFFLRRSNRLIPICYAGRCCTSCQVTWAPSTRWTSTGWSPSSCPSAPTSRSTSGSSSLEYHVKNGEQPPPLRIEMLSLNFLFRQIVSLINITEKD